MFLPSKHNTTGVTNSKILFNELY